MEFWQAVIPFTDCAMFNVLKYQKNRFHFSLGFSFQDHQSGTYCLSYNETPQRKSIGAMTEDLTSQTTHGKVRPSIPKE